MRLDPHGPGRTSLCITRFRGNAPCDATVIALGDPRHDARNGRALWLPSILPVLPRGDALMLRVAWLVAQVLYLFTPLLASAVLSGVVIRFDLAHWLKRPIDGGATFRGHRLFGDSKTWRGIAVAVVGSIVTVAVQRYALADFATTLVRVDYRHVSPVLFGGAMGAGATLGELPNSFVKRQLGIAPGSTTRSPLRVLFYLWDQVDLLLLTWPLLWLWMRPDAALVVTSFVLAATVHPLVSVIGFAIGARKTAR